MSDLWELEAKATISMSKKVSTNDRFIQRHDTYIWFSTADTILYTSDQLWDLQFAHGFDNRYNWHELQQF